MAEFFSECDELEEIRHAIMVLDRKTERLDQHAQELHAEFKDLKSRGIEELKANWDHWKAMTPSQRVMAGGERMKFFSLDLEYRQATGARGLVLNWRRGYFSKNGLGGTTKLVGAKYLAPDRSTKGVSYEKLAKCAPKEFMEQVWQLEQRAMHLRQAQLVLTKARRVLAAREKCLKKSFESCLPF